METTLTENPEKRFYSLHVFTKHEEKVKHYLETEAKRLGLEEDLGQILIPCEEVVEMKAGKKKVKKRLLFPGYIFVEMALTRGMTNLIQEAPTTMGLLQQGGEPTPLSHQDVERIHGKVAERRDKAVLEIPFDIDEQVKIIDGPFKDFIGMVREIHAERHKLKVMVAVFGRPTPVEVDFLQVTNEFTNE
jgi:transcription termination/antitermination protein NusG